MPEPKKRRFLIRKKKKARIKQIKKAVNLEKIKLSLILEYNKIDSSYIDVKVSPETRAQIAKIKSLADLKKIKSKEKLKVFLDLVRRKSRGDLLTAKEKLQNAEAHIQRDFSRKPKKGTEKYGDYIKRITAYLEGKYSALVEIAVNSLNSAVLYDDFVTARGMIRELRKLSREKKAFVSTNIKQYL